MISVASLVAFFFSVLAMAGVAPVEPQPLASRQDDSFMAQNWANHLADLEFKSGPAGQYSVTWDNPPGGNFVVGKGYKPGGDMLLNYSGTFEVNGSAYLALYGWTTEPLVEYYVIESMGRHNPSDNTSATQYGTVETDGGVYEIWQKVRTDAPSIIGTATFQQYWSIRTKMRCGGTINTGNHFRAWKAAGLALGQQDYLIMGIEGQEGSGAADITVGVAPTTPVRETPTPTERTETRRPTTKPTTTVTTTTTKPTTTITTTTTTTTVTTTTTTKPTTTTATTTTPPATTP